MGVRAACTPRNDVLQGELNDAIFAASFGQLIRGEGPAVYREPALFFRNTFPAEALCGLCQRVFGPLANPTEASRFFRLSTGFGGGKTHALMSLWHLAKNIADPTMGAHLLPPAGRPSKVCVIGVDGEGAGHPIFARHRDQEARSLAAELAFQLGGTSPLNALGQVNAAAACPDETTVDGLLPKNTPVLILLDELVLHVEKLTEQEVGNVLGFLRILITAMIGRPQAVLVITDPKDQPSNADNAAKLMRLAREFEQQTGRQATIIEPIGNQTAQVIVHRLFEQVKPDASAKASADYFSLYHRVAEDHPTLVPEAARTKDYADAIRVSYRCVRDSWIRPKTA
jgi:predicted AAA+ superfamily ATPase